MKKSIQRMIVLLAALILAAGLGGLNAASGFGVILFADESLSCLSIGAGLR